MVHYVDFLPSFLIELECPNILQYQFIKDNAIYKVFININIYYIYTDINMSGGYVIVCKYLINYKFLLCHIFLIINSGTFCTLFVKHLVPTVRRSEAAPVGPAPPPPCIDKA